MRILLVLAHPLEDSFAAAVAKTAAETLVAGGHQVDLLDLYREDFDPRLSEAERRGYFDQPWRYLRRRKYRRPAAERLTG